MSQNDQHHCCDCTDFPEPDVTDMGCCFPRRTRITCEAPQLVVPDCDEENPDVEYDADTEMFTIISKIYDENCSPLSDSSASILTGAIT